ncbi:hypothetical protein FMEAI12_2590017 [Parafrankia sp. Ea1.12]|nr:hypothetical protein FMEAI12_2590017 [Parafrankia sp. Ea1.12]
MIVTDRAHGVIVMDQAARPCRSCDTAPGVHQNVALAWSDPPRWFAGWTGVRPRRSMFDLCRRSR